MWTKVLNVLRKILFGHPGDALPLAAPFAVPAAPTARLNAGLLTDARKLTDPEIIDLFMRSEFLNLDPMEVLEELLLRAMSPSPAAVFVGYVDARPEALAIMMPPQTLSPYLLGFHFYNAGPAELRDLLLEEVVAWARRMGYDSCIAFATRGGAAWEKAFAAACPQHWGDIYQFDLKEAEHGFHRRRGRVQAKDQ